MPHGDGRHGGLAIAIDPDLQPLLDAQDDDAVTKALQHVLTTRALPAVQHVVRRRLRDAYDRQESDDLCGDAMVTLLSRFRQLREGGEDGLIEDVGAYAAVTAERVCNAHVRRKFPERARLKRKVRFLISRAAVLRTQPTSRGETLCGLAAWPTPWTETATGRLQALRASGRDGVRFAIRGADPAALPLSDLVVGVLTNLAAPVALDDLVSALADWRGVTDLAKTSELSAPTAGNWWENLADDGRPISETLDDRSYLRVLWEEIQDLPLNQRLALLLNLHDNESGDVLSLLPVSGVATLREIARSLEMDPAELAELWPRLPLPDLTLASRLGLTRQQVINLRKSARERLARRMRRRQIDA